MTAFHTPQESHRDEERLHVIRSALLTFVRRWVVKNVGPQDFESLVRVVHPEWSFPYDSLPSEAEFASGCDHYQQDRPAYRIPSVPVDMTMREEIAWYEERIRAIADRRGMDLCWELDGLLALLHGVQDVEKGRMNIELSARLRFCESFRCALYAACARKKKNEPESA